MSDLITSLSSISQNNNHKYSNGQHLLERVGGQGKFQKISFLVFAYLWFQTSWLLLGMGFFFDDNFTCIDSFSTYDQCLAFICQKEPNQRINYIASHSSSIVFQFSNLMICKQFEDQVPILQSLLFFGALVGFFVIPYIADNSGRKPAIQIAWLIGTVSVLIVCLSRNIYFLGVGLFFIGFGTNPAITLSFSFINQQCLGASRQRFGVGVQIALAIGQITIALLFLSILTWRQIMIILFIGFLVGNILCSGYILETPMFQIKKNRNQALSILNKMAKINQRKLVTHDQLDRLFPQEIKTQEQKEIEAKNNNIGVLDLFRYKSLRWISISSGIVFFGIQTIYYSTTLNLGSVGFNKTINQIIFGVSEMLGYIAAQFIIDKVKRKKATYIGLGITSGICLILSSLVVFENESNVHYFKWLEASGLMVNRFILCGFWSIFYVFVAQMYPTQTRSLGYGWTSILGMVGSTLSPYITTISALVNMNSWLTAAIIGFISLIFIFCLKQTYGEPLQDVIQERMSVLIEERRHTLQIEDKIDIFSS